ncbi:hypothetical protein MJO28_000869 [Puccinia striiformis f. sp. tritici]|uniref:Glucanase n=3 Tax=Puccinia striiformis TaxID=27350 RepID=A0A2S4W6B1_9BASI|nr:hypothetical protein Pst134EA_000381 [Puccinia striiformis f. sp. tritici]KAH9473310.1 hypothetical protein Pst134EA_000381 [Puccinia striiformis f. sp. tritici]KAI7962775.1 hypothetical protein MJO28_000869 [Puccinia striiformis f. sp. tritici]POW14050.1 hypothetical protein PSHT_07504 [Puccinia striiformis]POW17227.1 hypothetical protein PSTT_00567 [Puccinia striiformis]
MKTSLWCLLTLQRMRGALAQQVGIHLLQESHPSLKVHVCGSDGLCSDKKMSITLDADIRPLQVLEGMESCISEEERAWNTTVCPNSQKCSEQCSLGGVKYKSVHGISTHDHGLHLKLFTHGKLTESRVFLLANEKHYHTFYLKNQQFSFDVDASEVPCGVDAALYFTSMKADGGLSHENRAGAMYGTGYCDAQCPTSLRFIDGKANLEGTGQTGKQVFESMGACCPELDLWEGNGLLSAYAAHPCVHSNMSICEGEGCTAQGGLCDHSGCAFASQRVAGNAFYGPSKTIDTRYKFTVVTQFLTSTGTAQGELVEIRQFYIQNGTVIRQQSVQPPGYVSSSDSITEKFCENNATASGREFQKKGGLTAMGRAMDQGMVLVMGLWTDEVTNTLGSIQKIPATRKANLRRINGQICPERTRTQPFIQKHHPDASVHFSNIRIEPINSIPVAVADHYPVRNNEHTII